jgi:threonine dehydrogenase-like Zn-dependent dehydrogenase
MKALVYHGPGKKNGRCDACKRGMYSHCADVFGNAAKEKALKVLVKGG